MKGLSFTHVGHIRFKNPFTPTMQQAYECDLEWGSHHLNNMASDDFAKHYPTILAMAGLIEKERDKLRQENKRLKKLMSRIAELSRNQRTADSEETKQETGS